MDPCTKNRKLIAWLALNALDAQKAARLREHLALCEGCRHYWEEISNVAEGLATAAPNSNLEASDVFLRRMAEKLEVVQSSSGLEDLLAWLRGSMLNWRVALPAIAVLVIALFAMVARQHHPVPSRPASPTVQVESGSGSEGDLAPTIANYQMIASQSLEKLDELLTRQGNKPLPPAPVYTVSGLAATASF
jgi:hypothetical protein